MLVRSLDDCEEFVAGDGTILRELLHADKHQFGGRYSLAHAILPAGQVSYLHSLATNEVYYILSGNGMMEINGEQRSVTGGDCIVIPGGATQRLHNTSTEPILFLCIVDPAWQVADETVWR
jgi:mannose-6-phosphate isomerase-like protein (cupin superfamily)